MTTTARTPDDDPYLEHIETFFDYVFGEQKLPVRSFDSEQDELEYLVGGGVYASSGACQVCEIANAPFIIYLAETDDESPYPRVWRATCLECFAQIRVPTFIDENGQWAFDEEAGEIVGLEPIPTYQEAPVEDDTVEDSVATPEEESDQEQAQEQEQDTPEAEDE